MSSSDAFFPPSIAQADDSATPPLESANNKAFTTLLGGNRGAVDLGVVTYAPQGSSSKVYRGMINDSQSITREDNKGEYRNVLEFIDAIDREVQGLPPLDPSVNSWRDTLSRFSASGRADAMYDEEDDEEDDGEDDGFDPFLLNKDSSNPINMTHSNVWL